MEKNIGFSFDYIMNYGVIGECWYCDCAHSNKIYQIINYDFKKMSYFLNLKILLLKILFTFKFKQNNLTKFL